MIVVNLALDDELKERKEALKGPGWRQIIEKGIEAFERESKQPKKKAASR